MGDKLKNRHTRPDVRDMVAKRGVQENRLLDTVKGSPARHRKQRAPGITVTCSFTITEDIDAEIERISQKLNCSRSRVVRQAIVLYGGSVE